MDDITQLNVGKDSVMEMMGMLLETANQCVYMLHPDISQELRSLSNISIISFILSGNYGQPHLSIARRFQVTTTLHELNT